MRKENASPKPARTVEDHVGDMLEHTVEAMSLSSDPAKRAAAARWMKIIRRNRTAQRKSAA